MGSPNKDYYSVLELDRKADNDAIKKAYRRLALKYHPDRNPGNEKFAEEKFREIHEAYAILSDPQKKEEYDTYGANGVRDRPVYQNTEDLFNMFNSFFGGNPFPPRNQFFTPRSAFSSSNGFHSSNGFSSSSSNGFRSSSGFHDFTGFPQFRPASFDNFETSSTSNSSSSSNNSSSSTSSRTQSKQKMKMTVNVGFKDSVLGCSRQISLEYATKCSVCVGTGAASGRVHDTLCSKCGGAGRIRDTRSPIPMTCAECGGLGRSRTASPCGACLGTGKTPKVHEEELVVPPGIGPTSVMKRVITPDENEDEVFEVTIDFTVETHPFFKRTGSDAHLDVPITYTQAVLGDTIQVPCIYGGTTEVKIPAGSQPMGEFVLVGQGFFNLDGNGQGDMILKWILEVPKVLTPDESKVIAQLSQLEQGSLPEKRVQFLQFLIDWDAESP